MEQDRPALEGEPLQVWSGLMDLILEWEDACEAADALATRIMSKYRLRLPADHELQA